MRYPPKLDPDKLDFSQFHPLDHRPFDARCRTFFPHGRAAGMHHVRIAWQWKWKEEVFAKTTCKLGWHKRSTAFRPREQVMHASCRHCWRRLGPDQPMDQLSD